MLHKLLLAPLLDDFTDFGGGGPDDQGPLDDGGNPDDSSGTTADGSYWANYADGSSYYWDAKTGQEYSTDANGNVYDGQGKPVTDPGILSKLGNALKNSGSGNGPNNASAAGKAAGAAATAAGNNRLTQEQLALQQEGLNLTGTNNFESQMMARAQQEQSLKNSMFTNLGSANALDLTANRAANPRVSPFDPTGGPKYSPDTIAALKANAAQGQTAASTPNQYGASSWPAMTPFKPIDLTQVQQATGTKPGLLEQFGNAAAGTMPWLSILFPDGQPARNGGASRGPTVASAGDY